MGNDIDSIFSKVSGSGVIKGKKPAKGATTGKKASTPSTMKDIVKPIGSTSTETPNVRNNKVKRIKGTSNDPFELGSTSKRNSLDFTEEGWRVYTPEELNIGKGGDTNLCPFDCDCCF
jgi:hypothetical protein